MFKKPSSQKEKAAFKVTAAMVAGVILGVIGGYAIKANAQTTGLTCSVFTKTLTVGSNGSEVKSLQQFLNSSGIQVSASGAGSVGSESTYFGAKTKAAVSKFQVANSITPTAGYWGPISRARATALCSTMVVTPVATTTPVVTANSGSLNIGIATQPENSLAPGGTSRVPFTTFKITNNTGASVTVNGVTVQRSGLAVDAVFSGIVLVDEQGLQIDIAKTLNSNHQAIIGGAFVLAPGQTKTLTVAGNMQSNSTLSSYTGQIVSLTVVGVNTSAVVNGTLPVTGAQRTIVSSLAVGSVTAAISSLDPNSAQSKNIGDTGLKFSGLRLTAGSAEDVKLFSVRWRLNGTVSSNDLANIVTVVNGVNYPTSVSVDGRYFTSTFPGGILITKGNSVDALIQGDVTGSNASGRVVEFDVDKTSDVYFVGQLYGYGIAVGAGSDSVNTSSTHGSVITNSNPWFEGSTVSISGASVTSVAKANSVQAQNIAVNVSNQPLGGYTVDLRGESVSVQSQVFNIATSSSVAGSGVITNVSIYDENGSVVAGPVDAVIVDGSNQKLTFTDTVTYATGVHTYTLKGKIPSGFGNNSTVQLSFNPATAWTNVTGQITGNTITFPNSTVTANLMTIKSASLTVTASPSPSSQTIVAGGQGIELGNIQLDASQSGEDLRLSSLPISIITSSPATNLTTCQVYKGNSALNFGSNVVNPSSSTVAGTNTTSAKNSFTLNDSLVIPRGTTVTLTVRCNVASGATGSYQVGINSGNAITVTGLTSGNTISGSALAVTTGVSGLQTVTGNGSFTIVVDQSSSPSFTLAAGGTTGQKVAVFKLRSVNEDVTLNKIGITLANSVTNTKATADGNASFAATDVTGIHFYNAGGQELGSASLNGTNLTATSTQFSGVNLFKNVDYYVTVKVDLANIGTGLSGGIGDIIKVEPVNAEGSGVSSGQTIAVSGSGTVSGVQLFRSYPVVAAGPATDSNPNGQNRAVKKFTITANGTGPVSVSQLSFEIATSGATASNFKLFAYTGSDYASGAVSGIGSNGQFGGTLNGSTLTFSSNPALQIGSGSTVYFVLQATVSPNSSVTNWSVNTTLQGNASQLGGLTPGYNVASSTAPGFGVNDFIWSDNASATASASDVDWTNGYSVPGLSSSGL
jgi:hypothetical protein